MLTNKLSKEFVSANLVSAEPASEHWLMVQFLFIRHAESKDNLSGVWAGWKDSPLSNHGMHQCRALADALSRTRLSGIHSSDLQRANMTATVVKEKQSDPNIPFKISSLLREQYFGAGEGKKICAKNPDLTLALHYARGKFPAIYTRTEKFPGGESLDDLTERVNGTIDDVLVPYVWQEAEGGVPVTVAIVSHSIFIAELVTSLVKRDDTFQAGTFNARNLRGLKNTSWTKVEVTFKEADSLTDGNSISLSLIVKVLAMNRYSHLVNLHRQKGGIGSMAHDPKQQDIQAFFHAGHTKRNQPTHKSTISPESAILH